MGFQLFEIWRQYLMDRDDDCFDLHRICKRLSVALMRSMYNGNCAKAKKVTGKHMTAYMGYTTNLSLFSTTKKSPAQNATSIEAIPMKREVSPRISFTGSPLLKSLT